MKIGLLECDHVRDELKHIAGDYRQMFPALFAQVAPDWGFEFYDVCNGHFPDDTSECDAYICTGSKNSVYDNEEWIVRLQAFVRELRDSGKVYVGICFGHQLLGESLAGKVQKSEVGWCVGIHSFEVLRTEKWMAPSLSVFNLLMMCQDQVLQLPTGSLLLARTEDCPNAIFQVGDNMLGIQAHPEFSKEYDQALMELRVERIGQEKVATGISSLQMTLNDLEVASWIRNFIEMKR